eukprot:CAMPEP_0204567932 /NCGR_PEP_ID=MMETSP0661-20131031/36878_1 /ASSEMBLY_ACC=CAM_ASM_000606 /TAXON_ID=109239 /ORGANISM="Alexandrium margalefi, Strain AMGDE01CS-322" /LENGTH=47 /DNA_ID= /DNA_START= /DNA_END= /DNA_ORIENTATION=
MRKVAKPSVAPLCIPGMYHQGQYSALISSVTAVPGGTGISCLRCSSS